MGAESLRREGEPEADRSPAREPAGCAEERSLGIDPVPAQSAPLEEEEGERGHERESEEWLPEGEGAQLGPIFRPQPEAVGIGGGEEEAEEERPAPGDIEEQARGRADEQRRARGGSRTRATVSRGWVRTRSRRPRSPTARQSPRAVAATPAEAESPRRLVMAAAAVARRR